MLVTRYEARESARSAVTARSLVRHDSLQADLSPMLPLGPFRRRNYVAISNMLRVDPAVWEPGFWASIRLARRAQQLGALQKLRELAPLIALLRRRAPRVVLEIGTARGGTFYAWCQVAEPTALVVSIDLPDGPFGGERAATDSSALRRYGQPGQQLHFIRDDSHDIATRTKVVEILGGKEIDFLMIDGDHTYEGVRQDFEMYAPLVGDGSPVAFHDILPHPEDSRCEVDRFWNEIRNGYRHIELTDVAPEAQYGGIGVLYWDRSAAELA
jgi:cephalosporin hydroxylase